MRSLSLPLSLCVCGLVSAAPVEVPAFTAYGEAQPDSLRVARGGITGWSDPAQPVLWGGRLAHEGPLTVAVGLKLPADEVAHLRLSVTAVATGVEAGAWDTVVHGTGEPQTADFGSFTIVAPGYHRFTLTGVSRSGATFGTLTSLRLDGPAAVEAQFNLEPRRNAASVHWGYPLAKGTPAVWFYNEVTPRAEPLYTYYCACGFAGGYFGMQVNSPTERRIIFSIWDSSNEAVSRSKVAADDRTKLLAKGSGVVAGDFGNEGTGGHSHLVYPWVNNQPYRFLVVAEPAGDVTTYSGYFYFAERGAWGLIARFRKPKDGQCLRGLYSFNENFGGSNGHLRRLAEFGPGWVKLANGRWQELRTAKFSHDPTGKVCRRDYGCGVTQEGRLYLSNGGFVADPVVFGQPFTRPSAGPCPSIELPKEP